MGELRIRRAEGAVELEVRVAPRASRDAVLGVHGGALKVALTAPPVEGKANAALERLLAKALGLPARSVAVVRGSRGRAKTVRIEGVSPEALPWRRGGGAPR